MDKLKILFDNSTFINHVNFSGMNLGQDQVFQICDLLRNCQFLLGVHMSDNGICNSEYFTEML